MCTAIKQAVRIYCIVPKFVRIGDLLKCAWFIVVHNLAVDVLAGTCFIDCYIWSIFPSECNVVPCHSRTVSMLSLSPTVSSFFSMPLSRMYCVPTPWSLAGKITTTKRELYPCIIFRQIVIPPSSQGTVSFRCFSHGVLLVETHPCIVEWKCSMAAKGTMGIPRSVMFYIYCISQGCRQKPPLYQSPL